jgi:hypothetical protein
MNDRRLSLREQRILAEIETALSRDRKLDAWLRELRLPRRLRALSVQRRLRGAELGLLIPATLLLLLASIRTAGLGVIIACCVVGSVSLLLAFSIARTRVQRRGQGRIGADPPGWLTPPNSER